WMPPVGFDTRRAWEGPLQGTPYRVRVEAAADHGKPTYFEVLWPWQRPLRQEPPPRRSAEAVRQLTYVLLVVAATLAAALLARRNWRLGRGDRRGALRVAVYVLLARI